MPKKLIGELLSELANVSLSIEQVKQALLQNRCLSAIQVKAIIRWLENASIHLRAAANVCNTKSDAPD